MMGNEREYFERKAAEAIASAGYKASVAQESRLRDAEAKAREYIRLRAAAWWAYRALKGEFGDHVKAQVAEAVKEAGDGMTALALWQRDLNEGHDLTPFDKLTVKRALESRVVEWALLDDGSARTSVERIRRELERAPARQAKR
jgi:hypothetical protein